MKHSAGKAKYVRGAQVREDGIEDAGQRINDVVLTQVNDAYPYGNRVK